MMIERGLTRESFLQSRLARNAGGQITDDLIPTLLRIPMRGFVAIAGATT